MARLNARSPTGSFSDHAAGNARCPRRSGDLTGLTGNYIEVSFAGPEHLRRGVARVRVTQAGEVSASGVLEDARAA